MTVDLTKTDRKIDEVKSEINKIVKKKNAGAENNLTKYSAVGASLVKTIHFVQISNCRMLDKS